MQAIIFFKLKFFIMKKFFITLLFLAAAGFAFADSMLIESFEYGNHDGETPVGWVCDDDSWICGYLEKDHNRRPHTGNWYAHTNADESWMFINAYLSNQLKYRFSFWGVSDGSYDVEFWAGNSASANDMTFLLFTATINSDTYDKFSAYIESLSGSYSYFGIHATASSGAYYLTIDDVYVEVVDKYNMEITPMTVDTVMYAGTQMTFNYTVQNTGYESMHIYMNGHTDYFTDIHFTADGANSSSFNTVAEQTVQCTCTATLKPDVEPGSTCWIDIVFTVSCDCITRMATVWVTPLGTVTDFPVSQSFDDNNFVKDGWIITGNMRQRWQWSDDYDGTLLYRSSVAAGSSLFFSPKMRLNENGNTISLKLYHSESSNNDRINVYYNTDFSLKGAEKLATIYRRGENETGWMEHQIGLDCQDTEGFVIIEAVGDFGDDIIIDDIVIYNSPLSVDENDNTLKINVYPNPSTGNVTIEGTGTMTVTNILGQVVIRKEIVEKEVITLPKGVYFVKIGNSQAQRVVVEI